MYFSICNLLINYLNNFYHYFCILSFSSFCFKYIRYFIVPAWPLDDNWANSHKLVRNPDLGCSSALLVQLIIHFSNFYYWIIASAFENERPCSFLCTIVLDIFLQPFIYHYKVSSYYNIPFKYTQIFTSGNCTISTAIQKQRSRWAR